MFISIIIPTLNRRRYVIESLNEAVNQAREFDDVEIIVVDNDSTDDTKDAVNAYISTLSTSSSRCKYVLETSKGSNYSRNRGRVEANGKILALLDDDAVAHPNWVAKIREHFLAQKSDCIAGRVELRLEHSLPDWFPPEFQWILGKTEYGDHSRPLAKGEYPQSNNCAFTAEMFDALGGFNPNSLIYGDETEFFRRAEKEGFSMTYLNDVVVDHCIPAERLSKEGLYNKGRLWGKGSAYYWLINKPNSSRRIQKIIEYAARTGYLWLKVLILPNFARVYTYNFYLEHFRQLVKGSK